MMMRPRAIELSLLSTALALALVAGCVSGPDEGSYGELSAPLGESTAIFCPPGTSGDLAKGYCVDSDNAYGPFTNAMIAACVSAQGGGACVATRTFQIDGHDVQIPRWGKNFAASLRGTGRCMAGATFDASLGACVEGENAFGPFPTAILAACVVNSGGDACYKNRWSKSFYAGLASHPRPNFAAANTLEYHVVTTGADRSLAPGIAVTTGHMQRLGREYSRDADLVTFDDGYAGVFTNALPNLAAARVPAVAAIIVDATRDSGSPDAQPTHMSRAELTTLVRAGWVLALHAGTGAEHELNYAREAEILRTGQITSSSRSPATISLSDARAVDYLADLTFQTGGPTQRLLDQLRADRARAEGFVNAGASSTEAATHALTDRLYGQRQRLAQQAGIPIVAIDTFIYPHSESNDIVRSASARAGFVRGYAGGAIGDAADAFNLPRRWMNDQTNVP